jgi:hypothetical protein
VTAQLHGLVQKRAELCRPPSFVGVDVACLPDQLGDRPARTGDYNSLLDAKECPLVADHLPI